MNGFNIFLAKFKLLFSILLMIILGIGTFFIVKAETNTIAVDACESAGNGVRVERGGSWSILTNGCRDAGHGYRNYTLQCVSEKSYQVFWEACESPQPVVISAPTPVQIISQPTVQAPETVQIIQPVQPNSTQTTVTQPNLTASTCSNHGFLHGDHCDCYSGYYASGLSCLPLPSVQPVANQPTVTQPIVTQPAIIQTVTQPTIVVPECSGHGYKHEDHCDCDPGYYGSGLSCLPIPTIVQPTVTQPVITPNIQAKNIVTFKNNPDSPKIVHSVSKVIACGGHGQLHGDHCDCDSGYFGSGLNCLPLPGTKVFSSPVEMNKVQDNNLETVTYSGPESIEKNPSECGGHGRLHGDHCDCNEGYFANKLHCLPVPVIETFALKNGGNYRAEDFWAPHFKINWYYLEEKTVLNWISPQVPHDGYFLYLSPNGFPGKLSDYDPIILPRYRESFIFSPEKEGEYVAYVIPFVYLTDGRPRALGGGVNTSQYVTKPKFSLTKKIQQSIYKTRLKVANWISPE